MRVAGHIARSVIGEGCEPTGLGLLIGLGVGGRAIETDRVDALRHHSAGPVVVRLAALVLGAWRCSRVALPARRAARVDPLVALRAE